MPVVVDLGGEGNVPGAINVNIMLAEMMLDPTFDTDIDPALVIRRSAHDTGLDANSVDTVLASHFPIQFNELVVAADGTRVGIDLLAAEVARILKPGGGVRFHCSSCDRLAILQAFEDVGLGELRVTTGGYIEGVKP